ncbi:unnamed protein product, partial [Coregonus sp. 'balchen']
MVRRRLSAEQPLASSPVASRGRRSPYREFDTVCQRLSLDSPSGGAARTKLTQEQSTETSLQDSHLLDWSNSGMVALALGSDVFLWKADTHTLQGCIHPRAADSPSLPLSLSHSVSSVSWSRDGCTLSIGTKEGGVQWVCSTNKGACVGWSGRRKEIGWPKELIATGGGQSDGVLRIWNNQSGTCVDSAQTNSQVGHMGRVLHLAVSPSGTKLLSAGANCLGHVWNT